MKSLRSRLILWLMPPLVGVGLIAAGASYVSTTRQLTEAYDRDLADIARAVVPYVERQDTRVIVAFTPQADAVLRSDSSERIFYTVLDDSGRYLAGDPGFPAVPHFEGDGPIFWNAPMAGRDLRLAALRTRVQGMPMVVVAAETTSKRDVAARNALVSAIAPVIVLAGATLACIIIGVGLGLLPIDRLRRELQTRSHKHLPPVTEGTVVEELRPLVHALNEMLARLQEAQQTQTRFITNAAHQLRTPIAGIVTQLDLARTDEAARATHVEKAREGAARLARLAQQILSLAAADPMSNPAAPRSPCDLAAIVEGHADSWVRIATGRGVELEFDLEKAPIEGNALLVGELATNLVDNAARYGARNVRVTTRPKGEHSLLEVSDDGPGIPPAERSRVFERFQRLNNADGEGSGLGLAIVREIAQRHGATIAIEDAFERHGTRVSVLFPAG